MNLKDKLKLAWENRSQITEGFYNAYLSNSEEIKNEAIRRLDICRTNECGYHDQYGKSEKAVMKGRESCASCGCSLYEKAHSMSSYCPLRDLGQKPMWEELVTVEQEQEIQKIARQKYEESVNKQLNK